MAGSLGDWFKAPSRAEQLRAAGVRPDLIQAVERTAFGRPSDSVLFALPDRLSPDEVVIDLVEGRHDRRIGLLVLTTRRVLFVPKPARRPSPDVTMRLPDVVSASGHVHRGLSAVTLPTASGDFVVDQILGTQAETFVASLLKATSEPSPATPVRDPIEELAQLRAMHQAGVVPDGEFQLRKKQLFDQI